MKGPRQERERTETKFKGERRRNSILPSHERLSKGGGTQGLTGWSKRRRKQRCRLQGQAPGLHPTSKRWRGLGEGQQ